MAYQATGLQALFPIYLPRMVDPGFSREEYDTAVAQNESNLNQNLEALYQKLLELEAGLAQGNATNAETDQET